MNPISLVDGIESAIRRVAEVEIHKEAPVLQAGWVNCQGGSEGYANELPFSSVASANGDGHKKQLVCAADNVGNEVGKRWYLP